jgi:hypothetical protein
MPPSVVPNSKGEFQPNPLNVNCDRCCSLNGLDSSEPSGLVEWNANRVPITLSRLEVAIHRTSNQDQTPRTSQNGSLACIEGQLCEKPDGQRRLDESADDDVESQTQVSS